MAITKLTANTKGDPANSTGADVASSLNQVIDLAEANKLVSTAFPAPGSEKSIGINSNDSAQSALDKVSQYTASGGGLTQAQSDALASAASTQDLANALSAMQTTVDNSLPVVMTQAEYDASAKVNGKTYYIPVVI
jgi:hypothetical protein